MKTKISSTGSELWGWAGGFLHRCQYCLEQIIYSQYSSIPITIVWLVTSLLSLCTVCLDNKLFWLTVFSYINEQLQAKDVPCPSCDVYYKERKRIT